MRRRKRVGKGSPLGFSQEAERAPARMRGPGWATLLSAEEALPVRIYCTQNFILGEGIIPLATPWGGSGSVFSSFLWYSVYF